MSTFDPNTFLEMTVEESNSTSSTPVPVGEYTGVIEKIDARSWTSKKDPSKSGMTLDVTWLVDDSAVKELLGRDKVTVKQGIMLDLTDAGGLDMGKGKNVQLGRLREAVGLNTPGQPFGFRMLEGRMARISVSHRTPDDQPDVIFAEVKAVAKIG